jgi:hypothetical protein
VTFWQFCNNHPIITLLVALFTLDTLDTFARAWAARGRR